MLTFNAIDVETANAGRARICQNGIVHVRDDAIIEKWQTSVSPEDWFDAWTLPIYGVKQEEEF